jgi:hypothetical protein
LNDTIDRMDLTDRNKEESKSSWNLMKIKAQPTRTYETQQRKC